jgi:hypothetical protein
MSERQLEIARDADGRFLAVLDERRPPVEVTSWDDVRRLRGRTHLVDHWADGDLEAFIALHGHPFDDWWAKLSAACAAALAAHPDGAVPAEHHIEVKRTLSHQPRQVGLELQGSLLSAELRAYVAARAHRGSPPTSPSTPA